MYVTWLYICILTVYVYTGARSKKQEAAAAASGGQESGESQVTPYILLYCIM